MKNTVKNVLKNKRILVIEPDERARDAIKLHLEQRGAVVHTAGLVEKIPTIIAGSNVSGLHFQIILVEVNLPDCYGFFALRKILDTLAGHKIPIFVMSHGFSSFAIRQMVRYRVMGYLRKPFHLKDLEDFLVDRVNFFAQQIIEMEKRNSALNPLVEASPIKIKAA